MNKEMPINSISVLLCVAVPVLCYTRDALNGTPCPSTCFCESKQAMVEVKCEDVHGDFPQGELACTRQQRPDWQVSMRSTCNLLVLIKLTDQFLSRGFLNVRPTYLHLYDVDDMI